MFKKYNYKKDNFIEVIKDNKQLLLDNGIGNPNYISLMSYFPFDEKKYNIFISLKTNSQKYGFLVRYLMSCASSIGISEFLLTDFSNLKKHYDRYKKVYNEEKYSDINKYFKIYGHELSSLKNYISLYDKAKHIEHLESRFRQMTNLLIKMTIEKLEENYNRKNKIYNILNEEN